MQSEPAAREEDGTTQTPVYSGRKVIQGMPGDTGEVMGQVQNRHYLSGFPKTEGGPLGPRVLLAPATLAFVAESRRLLKRDKGG